jgi:hypothetical protein
MPKLYYTPTSCGAASFIVAHTAGLALACETVDLGTHKTASGADYYAINAKGNVPALVLDDGTVLNEGAAVLQWLGDQARACVRARACVWRLGSLSVPCRGARRGAASAAGGSAQPARAQSLKVSASARLQRTSLHGVCARVGHALRAAPEACALFSTVTVAAAGAAAAARPAASCRPRAVWLVVSAPAACAFPGSVARCTCALHSEHN